VQGNPIGTFLPLILLLVVFYFLLIRPQRKRQQEHLRMQQSLTPGTRVMTTTGLFGTVTAVDDDEMVLEIAPGVETRWLKAAVGRVITPGEERPGGASASAAEGEGTQGTGDDGEGSATKS
jgi:preprotein translocase subunit YajC